MNPHSRNHWSTPASGYLPGKFAHLNALLPDGSLLFRKNNLLFRITDVLKHKSPVQF